MSVFLASAGPPINTQFSLPFDSFHQPFPHSPQVPSPSPKIAMELPRHGRPTSAGDDGRLRCFPDPPPPPHAREADALQRDAALLRRRDELLSELHTEQIRLNMILCELVETEYAMAARSVPARLWPVPTVPWSQDRWHRRASSAATWEDAPSYQPSTFSELPPCSCRSPAAVRPPPVYPHVEQPPLLPIATSGHVEYCRSPSKQTLTEDALLPGVASASVKPAGSEFVGQEVTPKHKDAVGAERKADLKDGNGSGSQGSGQTKATETTMIDFMNEPPWRSCHYRPAGPENVALKQQTRLEFSELAPEQQECKSSGARVPRRSSYLELCQLPSKQTRADKSLVPVARGSRWDIGMEPKVDVENGHGMPPLYNIENQSSGQRKAEEPAMEAQIDGPVQSSCGYISEGEGNAAYSEPKGIELCEKRPGSDANQQHECRSSPRKQTPVEETLVPSVANAIIKPTLSMSQEIGEQPKVDMEDGQGARPFYGNRNQSSCQRKVVEPAMGAQIDKPLQQTSQSKPASQENAAYNEQKKIEISELTPERISSGLKRRLTVAAPLAKKQKPLAESSRIVNPSRWHQWNIEARQASMKPGEPNIKALPGQCNSAKNWEPVCWDGEENVAENIGSEDRTEPAASRWTCRICDAHCTSASNLQEHLGGRRHRENTEAILSEFRSSYSRMEADSSGKSAYYCEVCSVRCAGDTIMASHLMGRRHREKLQGL